MRSSKKFSNQYGVENEWSFAQNSENGKYDTSVKICRDRNFLNLP